MATAGACIDGEGRREESARGTKARTKAAANAAATPIDASHTHTHTHTHGAERRVCNLARGARKVARTWERSDQQNELNQRGRGDSWPTGPRPPAFCFRRGEGADRAASGPAGPRRTSGAKRSEPPAGGRCIPAGGRHPPPPAGAGVQCNCPAGRREAGLRPYAAAAARPVTGHSEAAAAKRPRERSRARTIPRERRREPAGRRSEATFAPLE